MDWTRRATINEQTDETTVDSRVLINFLPAHTRWRSGINIKHKRDSFFYAVSLDTRVTIVGRDYVHT